jgi:uracil-DNA glycosylase family 4
MIAVPPDPPHTPGAKLAIVGARPGREEARLGHPFVGGSGSELWKLLAHHGVHRSSCLVTNAVLTYDPDRALPTTGEIRENLPRLAAELREYPSNVILALGNEALEALCGIRGIDSWRGSILESTLLPGRKVVAAWHPANILRTYERRYILDADLRRAVQQSAFPEIRRPERNFIIDPTMDQCVAFLRAAGSEIVVDVECTRQLHKLWCVGVGDMRNSRDILCIPFTRGQMTISERVVVCRELQKVFDRCGIVGQNIGFDKWVLEQFGFRLPRIVFDTMLAHHLLWPEAGMKLKTDEGKDNFSGGHDLGFISACYTEEPYYKHEGHLREDSPEAWRDFWIYNCKDVAVTIESAVGLRHELEEFGQADYYHTHTNKMIDPVWRMQGNGLDIDSEALKDRKQRSELENKVLQGRLNRAVGFDINVRSTVHLRYLLHDKLHLPIKKRTKKGGAPATDEETLLSLAYNSPYTDLFKLILDVRERRTLLSGFMQLETAKDGRYRAAYLIHGTDSGRLSSRAPKDLDGRRGPQLQNIPVHFRNIFRAPEGCGIMGADLRRAEAMFVAYDSEDPLLMRNFETQGFDGYVDLGEHVLGISFADQSREAAHIYRDCFKQVTHASNYGMGPDKLIAVLRLKGIDIEDINVRGIHSPKRKAEYFLEGYHQRFPAVRGRWQPRLREEIRTKRTLYDAFGRRRFFMGRMDEALFRIGFSFRPQSTVVGITNMAFRRLDAWGWKMVLQVHDFVGIEYPLELEAECCRALQAAFNTPLTLNGRTIVIPVDIKAGPNWRDMKPVEIPTDELAESVHGVHQPARIPGDVSPLERSDDNIRPAGTEVIH